MSHPTRWDSSRPSRDPPSHSQAYAQDCATRSAENTTLTSHCNAEYCLYTDPSPTRCCSSTTTTPQRRPNEIPTTITHHFLYFAKCLRRGRYAPAPYFSPVPHHRGPPHHWSGPAGSTCAASWLGCSRTPRLVCAYGKAWALRRLGGGGFPGGRRGGGGVLWMERLRRSSI